MALPSILRRLFESDGYGPKLNRSVIPFASGSHAFSYEDVASSHWVKDLVTTWVYVAPAGSGGSDSNTGLSASSPVASFSAAVELCKKLPADIHRISVAAGTYSGLAFFENQLYGLFLEGDVTLSDGIGVQSGATVYIVRKNENITPTLTIKNGTSDYCIRVASTATLATYVNLSLIGNSSVGDLISLFGAGNLFFYNGWSNTTCSVTCNSIRYSCFAVSHSSFVSDVHISVSGTAGNSGIYAAYSSFVRLNDGYAANGLIAATGIYAGMHSFINIKCTSGNKAISFTTNGSVAGCIAERHSSIIFDEFYFVEANSNGNGAVFTSNWNSLIYIDVASGKNVYVQVPSGVTCDTAFHSHTHSLVALCGSGSIRVGGNYTDVLRASNGNSSFYIDTAIQFNPNWTSSRSVRVGLGCVFSVGNRADSALPGNGVKSIDSTGVYR